VTPEQRLIDRKYTAESSSVRSPVVLFLHRSILRPSSKADLSAVEATQSMHLVPGCFCADTVVVQAGRRAVAPSR